MTRTNAILTILACSSFGCAGDSSSDLAPSANLDPDIAAVTSGSWYRPVVATTWQWQLSGTINTGYAVDVYDVDLFETSEATIAALQAGGKKVLCYFSGGSSEDWRSDFGDFDSRALGNNLDDWVGERWLDIRSQNVLDVALARLDLAVTKGCDGVEPDNMDGFLIDTGFSLSASDQLAFNRRIANEAHERGLAVALKNDGDQAEDLVEYFDLSLNEQCHEYSECDQLAVFTSASKPIFNAEYNLTAAICPTALAEDIRTLILPLALDDSSRTSCD